MKEKEFNLSDEIYGGERLVHRDTKKAIKKCIKLILLDLDFLSNPDWREACAKIERRVGNKLVDFDRKW